MDDNRKELTDFQKRRLGHVALAMNTRLRDLIPGLEKDVFMVGGMSPDGMRYAIFPDNSAGVQDGKAIERVLAEFSKDTMSALKFVNPFRDLVAIAISLVIWETHGAFLVDDKKHKILKNKTRSPIYVDGAAIFTSPPFMNLISAFVQIEIQMALSEVDVIVGGEARGIPLATWIAKDLAKGTGIARKVIKNYGTGLGVDGGILPGDQVVLVEDLINDGGSKGPFIVNIRNAGAEVVAVIVVFDRKQGGEQYLREEFGVELISLTDIDIHLKVGLEYGYITKEEEASIRNYLADPKKWNLDRDYSWPIKG